MSSVWIGAAVAVGSAAYGGYQSNKANKANKANQEAFNKATIKNEKEARKLFNGFINDYNSSKEKLEEGLSLQEYIGNMVKALGDPELQAQYRSARDGDWEQAQRFADEATDQNISTFDRIIDSVSGGDYDKFIEARNKTVLGEGIENLYKEARRLQAPKQMAGSVRRDPETGEVLGGQRADKFEFDISTTAIKENNDRIFAKSSQAIEADRNTAARMQERAIQFLPMLDYSGFTAGQVVAPFQAQKLQAQLSMLGMEASMAANAMSMAFGKPLAPQPIDTSRYDQMAAQGTQQAIGSLAELYKKQRENSSSVSTSSGSNPYIAGDRAFASGARYGTSY